MVKKKVKKTSKQDYCSSEPKCHKHGGLYGLGVLGSAIYFISTATSFWMGALGLLKSIVWPVFMVYEAFKFLGA